MGRELEIGMSYELERGERFAKGIKRIMLEQVDLAAATLADPRAAGGIDEAIHQARKRIKRVRSALRVGRLTFGERQYRRENARFRRIASSLAIPRESAASVLTLDEVSARMSERGCEAAFPELRAHFIERRVAAAWLATETDRGVDRVRTRLEKARVTLGDLSVRDRSEQAWKPSLARAYRAGRHQMHIADLEPTPEVLHQWRKEAKHLRYHLNLLRGTWAGQLDRAEALLHELSDLLGLHHDLVDIARRLHETQATRSTTRRLDEARRLRAAIGTERVTLESEARDVGARIYSRRPKAVVKRVVSCWCTWRAVR